MLGDEGRFYTVDEVAELLGLHVKTVRGYVRSGKLPAIRIGKSYRITAADLAAFTGQPPAPPARETVRRTRRVETTAIVHIDAASPETLRRVEALAGAAVLAPSRVPPAAGGEPLTPDGAPLEREGAPLRMQTIYDEQRAELRVVVLGAPRQVASVLHLLDTLLEGTA